MSQPLFAQPNPAQGQRRIRRAGSRAQRLRLGERYSDMASEVAVAVIAGVAGLTSGAVSSLAAPWAKWGVTKREQDRTYRRQQIDKWRAGIASLKTRDRIIEASWYPEIRRYIEQFDPELLNILEPPTRTFVVPPDRAPGLGMWVDRLMVVVDRVEDDWELSDPKHRHREPDVP